MLFFLCAKTFACSCKLETFQNKIDRANLIYSGQVVDAALIESATGENVIKYSIVVDKVFKGDKDKKKRELVEELGHSCANSLFVGKKYLVFTDNENKSWLCSGTDRYQRYEYEEGEESLGNLIKYSSK